MRVSLQVALFSLPLAALTAVLGVRNANADQLGTLWTVADGNLAPTWVRTGPTTFDGTWPLTGYNLKATLTITSLTAQSITLQRVDYQNGGNVCTYTAQFINPTTVGNGTTACTNPYGAGTWSANITFCNTNQCEPLYNGLGTCPDTCTSGTSCNGSGTCVNNCNASLCETWNGSTCVGCSVTQTCNGSACVTKTCPGCQTLQADGTCKDENSNCSGGQICSNSSCVCPGTCESLQNGACVDDSSKCSNGNICSGTPGQCVTPPAPALDHYQLVWNDGLATPTVLASFPAVSATGLAVTSFDFDFSTVNPDGLTWDPNFYANVVLEACYDSHYPCLNTSVSNKDSHYTLANPATPDPIPDSVNGAPSRLDNSAIVQWDIGDNLVPSGANGNSPNGTEYKVTPNNLATNQSMATVLVQAPPADPGQATLKNLTPNTPYSFSITALNGDIITSPPANPPVSATFWTLPSSPTAAPFPPVPPVIGTSSITVNFAFPQPGPQSNPANTKYQAQASVSDVTDPLGFVPVGTPVPVLQGSGIGTAIVNGLNPGQPYFVRVCALSSNPAVNSPSASASEMACSPTLKNTYISTQFLSPPPWVEPLISASNANTSPSFTVSVPQNPGNNGAPPGFRRAHVHHRHGPFPAFVLQPGRDRPDKQYLYRPNHRHSTPAEHLLL